MAAKFHPGGESTCSVFPDYGRIRMENYAEAFRDLAFNFEKFQSNEIKEGESRGEYLARQRASEQWQRLGERFSDVAYIMNSIAGECYSFRRPGGIRRTGLRLLLGREGIFLKDAYVIRNRYQHREYCLSMRMRGKVNRAGHRRSQLCESEKAAEILSGVFGKRILPAEHCPVFIGDESREYLFVEQGIFQVATGCAAMTKAGETVSGDNYSFLQGRNGKMTALLADGVGSGEEACRDSGHLIDLAEKYLEAGFDTKQTMGILEGIMLGNFMENRMPTLDICEIDLYTGECEFSKLGSAPSLIKYDRLLEEIPADNLLLGYEKIKEVSVVRRQLKESNYIIMMTDGVSDYIREEQKKELFGRMTAGRGCVDPTVLANEILSLAAKQQGYDPHSGQQGKIRDDMTVLVLQIKQAD